VALIPILRSLGTSQEHVKKIMDADCGAWFYFPISSYIMGGSDAIETIDILKKSTIETMVTGKNQYELLYEKGNAHRPDWSRTEAHFLLPYHDLKAPDPRESIRDSPGGVPSGIISRESAPLFINNLILNMSNPGVRHTSKMNIYLDMTGNQGSQQPQDVSIPKGLRTGLWHVIGTPTDLIYPFSSNSYQSEAAFLLPGWRERLFGDNYERLLDVKEKYDPNHTFWCRHCIGDDGD